MTQIDREPSLTDCGEAAAFALGYEGGRKKKRARISGRVRIGD
jgi:hypothetical protein